MNSIEYAAVVIPTLNRYDHLKRCIESLKKSEYSSKTDLYIALDQAPSDKYETGRKQIEEYLDSKIEGFANVYVHKHAYNLGAVKNMEYVLKWASENHDRFIFTEDDNEFSPNYLEYVNDLLERYADDDEIVAVSGYNYPMKTEGIDGEIYYNKTYFAAFGFAGWFQKFNSIRQSMSKEWLYKLYKDSPNMKVLRQTAPNQYCNFVKGMLGYTTLLEKDNDVWKMDLTYGLCMFSNNKKMIFPVISKVRNWGYDGSGINCDVMDYDPQKPVTHRNFGFECQKLDDRSECVDINPVSESENKEIIDRVNAFFDVPTKEVFRCYLAYIASRIVGIDTMRKIWKK